jgi:hypothetical protein
MHSKESQFFQSFAVRNLIAENRPDSVLDCSAGGGGGSRFGIQSIGSGSGEFHSRRSDSCYCKLKPDTVESFAEAALLDELSAEVERALVENGFKIIGSGKKDSTSFYFEYAWEDRKGRVEISGKRLPSDYYNLNASLEESGKMKLW